MTEAEAVDSLRKALLERIANALESLAAEHGGVVEEVDESEISV